MGKVDVQPVVEAILCLMLDREGEYPEGRGADIPGRSGKAEGGRNETVKKKRGWRHEKKQ